MNERINRKLEIMSEAPTTVGKHVTSNDACAHCQWYADDSVFWLAQMMLCVMTLVTVCLLSRPNVILDCLTDNLSIRQLPTDRKNLRYHKMFWFPKSVNNKKGFQNISFFVTTIYKTRNSLLTHTRMYSYKWSWLTDVELSIATILLFHYYD